MFEQLQTWWNERRRASAARRAAHQAQARAVRVERQRGVLEGQLAGARERLDAVRTFHGLASRDVDTDVVIKKGETVYCVATGVILVEPRRAPSQVKGRSQGVSVPIPGTSIRYRVGSFGGQVTPGEDQPTPVDTGSFVVTSTRAVFTGEKASREWAWSKLVGLSHHPLWVGLAVSNRQKISGVSTDEANLPTLRFWIDLAVGRALDDVADLEDGCAAEVAALEAELAALDTPDPSPPGLTPGR